MNALPESIPRRFDVITEPWLPVTLTDGTASELGLKEVLVHAHEVRGLNEPSPLTYATITRYLIAILHRAIDGPENPGDWARRWRHGRFDEAEVTAYLDRWRHRFDLFHPERPFAQPGPDFAWRGEGISPISRLLPERASGSNTTLFDHTWDSNPPALTFAAATRALLTAQAYGFAGTGGLFLQTHMVSGYCILLEGNSLFQSLMLNLQRYTDTRPEGLDKDGDAPWWELDRDPPARKEGNEPLGLTDFLTWRGRAIRLLPDSDDRVRNARYEQWYLLAESTDEWRDPFKRYERSTTGDKHLFAKSFQEGRALWRDSDALIEEAERGSVQAENRPRPTIISWLSDAMAQLAEREQIIPTVLATGAIKETQATFKLWRLDRLPLPIQILNNAQRRVQVRDAVGRAQDVRGALYSAGTSFAIEGLSLGERSPDPKDVARERASLKLDERYWSRLDIEFQQFLHQLASANDPTTPLNAWMRRLRDIARTAYIDATTVASLDGRWFRAQALGARTLERQLRKALKDLYDAEDAARQEREEVA
jgi:CRISPR system Cascade subunit CasA